MYVGTLCVRNIRCKHERGVSYHKECKKVRTPARTTARGTGHSHRMWIALSDARERRPVPSYMPDVLWRDTRTWTILAPGAKQNWPTPADNQYIKKMYAALRELRRHNVDQDAREEHRARMHKILAM